MAWRRTLVLMACAWLAMWRPAEAQPPDRAEGAARAPQQAARASLRKERNGLRVLLIEYPWKVHARASVEVRLVTGKDAKSAEVAPMYFLQTRMKGNVTDWVHQCLGRAADGVSTRSFTADKIDFEIVGRRNGLEKPSVSILRRFEGKGAALGTAAAFLLLDSWAINEGLLYLDLPSDGFAAAGTLHVWFLRDDKVLWEETIDWPGYGP